MRRLLWKPAVLTQTLSQKNILIFTLLPKKKKKNFSRVIKKFRQVLQQSITVTDFLYLIGGLDSPTDNLPCET